MSNHYATELLVSQHQAELRHEADQDRLARLARHGGPARGPRSDGSGRSRPRWWERLRLFRSPALGSPARTPSASATAPPVGPVTFPTAARRPAVARRPVGAVDTSC
ncbi:hypothetical protein GCM10022204_25500 [Microlunatus aurantiacus]|uniref:Uncharacterized protein n=1 Tax=Microlunatus aurantiacus TaxID=446786 RepID=A0ABP7DMT7_9ACTN